MTLSLPLMHAKHVFLFPSLLLVYFLLTACTNGQLVGEDGSGSSSSSAISSSAASSVSTLPEGNFEVNDGNPTGTVYVRGYVTVEKVPEPFCEQNCKQYDYAFFYITETGNSSFHDFAAAQQGNAYVGSNPPRVGLGCIENNLVSYENHSDRYSRRQIALSKELSLAILNSTIQRPIVLKLDKERLSTGSGAPACYSHFTDVTLWTGESASSTGASQSTSSKPATVSSASPSAAATAKKCIPAGCSGQLCIEEGQDGVSTCEWREEYACYKNATCERQASGQCGWTQTAALQSCIQNAQSQSQGQAL